MKKLLLLFIFVPFFTIRAQQQTIGYKTEFPAVNSLQDKIYGLSLLWSEIKYNFVNIDQTGFDIDSLYRATMERVVATTDDLEYFDELNRFMARFNDGHTQIMDETFFWNDYYDYTPCSVIELGRKYYFSSYLENAVDPSLLGAEIIEVEGIPVREYVAQNIFPTICASTGDFKWNQAALKLTQGLKGTYFNGRARKLAGEVVPFSIRKNGETTRTDKDVYWSPPNRFRPPSAISLRWQDNGVAVLDIRSFQERFMPLLDSLMGIVIKDAKKLIVDMRYNGGGSTDVAHRLQMYLTKENEFMTFGSQTRTNSGYGRAQGNYREEYEPDFLYRAYDTEAPEAVAVEPGLPRVAVPTIILIGKRTYSAAEDFLVNMYEVPGRPMMIGEETGGSTGAPLVLFLPNGASARICTLRITYPYSGTPFVGKGVLPDIEVKQTIEDYLAGRDVVLEKAFQILN